MNIEEALAYATQHPRGVLATIKRDGRPQMSNIAYAVVGGEIMISVTDSRVKTKNARRDGRVSLHVTSADFRSYVVIDGDATVSAVTTGPDDEAAGLLRTTYETVAGVHPDWDEFNQAMIDAGRCVIRISPIHAYGMIG